MKKLPLLFSFLFLFFLIACSTQRKAVQSDYSLNGYEQHLLDSILQYGLDHEALYTLLTDIKPMSSLISFYYPLANSDTTKEGSEWIVDRVKQGKYLDQLYAAQKAINKLDFQDLKFILIPYQSAQKNLRIVQLSVVRISKLDSLLKAKEQFFGQFGLVPGADPIVVVSMIENAGQKDRWRGYGYLFGYPDYAVDFFVEATGKKPAPPREFFQIPAYGGREGYFVYAYPKEHQPTASVDSVLYYRAQSTLNAYKKLRPQYLRADSTVEAFRLLKDYTKKGH